MKVVGRSEYTVAVDGEITMAAGSPEPEPLGPGLGEPVQEARSSAA
jgi:hypothetical protein